MRVRVTTPNVMRALRKRDPGSAKPYNFAHSPILVDPPTDCTLIAPASKKTREWLTRDYTEIRSGEKVNLGCEYAGKLLKPQTISNVIWRHYLHPEDKSLSPDGKPCEAYTRGVLSRRPIRAIIPFDYIGKEIDRRAQEGEDPSLLEPSGPIKYGARRTAKTRAAYARSVEEARQYGLRQLMRESGTSQHATEQFLRGECVHPGTRKRLTQAVERLELSRH